MDGLQMKYFVLKPKGTDRYAEASRQAMFAYADCIARENPSLRYDLNKWAQHEEDLAREERATQPPKEG